MMQRFDTAHTAVVGTAIATPSAFSSMQSRFSPLHVQIFLKLCQQRPRCEEAADPRGKPCGLRGWAVGSTTPSTVRLVAIFFLMFSLANT